MRSTGDFSTYHPIINFGFFCAVIGIGIFAVHPVFLCVSVTASLVYAVITGGRGTVKFMLCFILPMIVFATVINPMTNQRGATVILTVASRNITMEALIYGLLTGLMLATILLWFSCYNKVMTGDKFAYLFGRVMPAISLILSMVMRFVPNYKAQIKKISDAQKCVGRDVTDGTLRNKARHGMKIMSVMFTWALENAIDSADSMRSRGYGLKNRTAFSIYRFDMRDTCAGVFLLVMTLIVVIGAVRGALSMEFYPTIVIPGSGAGGIVVYAAYFCLCYFPVAVEVKEAIIWKRLRSEI